MFAWASVCVLLVGLPCLHCRSVSALGLVVLLKFAWFFIVATKQQAHISAWGLPAKRMEKPSPAIPLPVREACRFPEHVWLMVLAKAKHGRNQSTAIKCSAKTNAMAVSSKNHQSQFRRARHKDAPRRMMDEIAKATTVHDEHCKPQGLHFGSSCQF